MTDYKAIAASLRACSDPQKAHAADAIEDLLRALSEGAYSWRPLPAINESGQPFDGRPVLIWTNHSWTHGAHRARWDDGRWVVDDCKHGPYALRGFTSVTHWMPLPEAPK